MSLPHSWNKQCASNRPSKRKKQEQGNTSVKMNSLNKEEPAAAAPSSSSAAGEASTSGYAATVKSNASAGAAKYDGDSSTSDSDDDALDGELGDFLKRAIIQNSQSDFDMVIKEYNDAITNFERKPENIVYHRNHRYDVYVAALDNIINQEIERTHSAEEVEEREASIRLIVQRFYYVVKIWVGRALEK